MRRASVTRRTFPSQANIAGFSHLESAGEAGEHRLDLQEDVGLVVAEVVEIRVEGGVDELELVVGGSIMCMGGTLTDPLRSKEEQPPAAAAVPRLATTTASCDG